MTRLSNFRAEAAQGGWEGVADRLNERRGDSNLATPSRPGDPTGLLPTEARDRLNDLRERRSELAAVVQDLTEQAEEARLEKHSQERHLRALQSGEFGLRLRYDAPEIAAQLQKIDAVDAELRRLEARRDARSVELKPLGQLIQNVERWLADMPAGAEITTCEAATPALKKGESPATAIEGLRRRRLELQADLAAVHAAPVTSKDAKALARAEVERLGARGAPDCFGLVEHGDSVRWPMATVTSNVMGFAMTADAPQIQARGHAEAGDALALICWINRGPLIEALEREIDELADDANALTAEQRVEKIAEIREQIISVERDEAALISDSGGSVAFRADCDPRAVLRIHV